MILPFLSPISRQKETAQIQALGLVHDLLVERRRSSSWTISCHGRSCHVVTGHKDSHSSADDLTTVGFDLLMSGPCRDRLCSGVHL